MGNRRVQLTLYLAGGIKMNVEARGDDVPQGVRLDYDLLTVAMVFVMILGLVMVWEGLKWLVMEINYQWTPGSSRRRLRRLERLREATTLAIQEELDRRANSTTTRSSSTEAEGQVQSRAADTGTSSSSTTQFSTNADGDRGDKFEEESSCAVYSPSKAY